MYRLNPWAKHRSSYARFCCAEIRGRCADAFSSCTETGSAAPPKPPAIGTHCCAHSLRQTPVERKGKEMERYFLSELCRKEGCCAEMGCSCAKIGSTAPPFGRGLRS